MPAPSIVDLRWLGRERCVGAWRVGDVLVDCGPTTTLETLLAGLGDWRPRALLLTHIHFDHGGAAGALVRRWPDLEVLVHRRGARHLVAPERLEASARRVFGDAVFEARFGPMLPVPEANVRALDGGEVVHGFTALDTPGHASHHLAFVDDEGHAFCGDVAGVRLTGAGPLLIPTPPPDVDLAAWPTSLERIAQRAPTWLGLPHFGAVQDAAAFLDAARAGVARQAQLAALDEAAYAAAMREELGIRGALLDDYLTVVPLENNWRGLQRWAGTSPRPG